jgi:hypothetical protein
LLYNVGVGGYYYSSSPNAAGAYDIDLSSGGAGPAGYNDRSYAQPVRCVKEFISVCYQPRKSTKHEKKKPSPEFHQRQRLMEAWPINSAVRQLEQKRDFPLVIKTRLYPCSGIAPSADTFNPEAAFFPLAGNVTPVTAC